MQFSGHALIVYERCFPGPTWRIGLRLRDYTPVIRTATSPNGRLDQGRRAAGAKRRPIAPRSTRAASSAERLRSYIFDVMTMSGIKKLEGSTDGFRAQADPSAVLIDDISRPNCPTMYATSSGPNQTARWSPAASTPAAQPSPAAASSRPCAWCAPSLSHACE